MTGRDAHEVFRSMMANGDVVPFFEGKSAKMCRARCVLLASWFKAMATQEEKAILLPPKKGVAVDLGERVRISFKLNHFVVGRLAAGFQVRAVA